MIVTSCKNALSCIQPHAKQNRKTITYTRDFLKRLSRSLSRKIKGSNYRGKAKQKITLDFMPALRI